MAMSQTITSVDSQMLCIIKGLETPTINDAEEWLQFEMLASMPNSSRKENFYEDFSFQLICYTRQANLRQDKKFGRHYELAKIYKPYLHLVNYQIKNACIRFKEAKISYLDLRTATFTAKAISTGGTPPLDTLCAVILSESYIDTPR